MRYEAPWHVIAMGALLFGLTIGLHSLGVLYLTQVPGLEVSALGVAIAVILVTAALLKGPVSYLVDRVDAPGLVVAGLATALAIASPLVLLGDTVSALVALAGFVVVGTVAELPSPLVKAMVVQRVEQHRIGTALGVQEHARRVAAVIVPTVAGLLAPLITLEVAVAGVLAMAAPSIALAVPVARAERIGGSQAATSG